MRRHKQMARRTSERPLSIHPYGRPVYAGEVEKWSWFDFTICFLVCFGSLVAVLYAITAS